MARIAYSKKAPGDHGRPIILARRWVGLWVARKPISEINVRRSAELIFTCTDYDGSFETLMRSIALVVKQEKGKHNGSK